MIEFDGYINGTAAKYLLRASRKTVLKLLIFAFLVLLPGILMLAILTEYWGILIGYAAMCIGSLLLLFIPRQIKKPFLPKKIFTDNEYIVCICDNNYEEYNLISDVDKVLEYEEFYYLSFPFGKKSDQFICQKSLLTKGSLEEFEALFEGKIEKRY